MISPSEILKGSILCHEGKVKLVIAIGDYIQFSDAKVWIGGSMINGEPLCEAWLNKMGFVDQGNGEFFRQLDMANWGMKVVAPNIHSSQWTAYAGFVNTWQELKQIEYCHQLQLLFFAMFSEHIKLPKIK